MRRWFAPFWLPGLLLALTAGAAANPVTVDVSTASGVRLGRLSGESQSGVPYYLLNDVARLANAKMHRNSRGDRMTLTSRRSVVEVTRDSRRVTIDGRVGTLAAPVRARQGTWRVPGDLVPKVLPTLVGAAVRVTPAEVSVAAPAEKPAARPAVAAPAGAVAVPAVAAPRPESSAPPPSTSAPAAAPSPATPAPVVPSRPAEIVRTEPELPPAPVRPVAPGNARVELRVRSYPTYTRL